MDRWQREQDREQQQALLEHKEAVKRMRRTADSDLRAGHAEEDKRVRRERDEKLARGFERDREFEQTVAAMRDRGERLSPQMTMRIGFYESRRAAARRAGRKDAS